MRRDAAFHHPHEDHGAAINVEPGIENQRLQRIFRAAFRWRNAVHDRFEDVFHAETAFRADHQRVVRGNGENTFDLLFYEIGLRSGQIDFVDDRKNGEIVSSREKGVRDGLRLHALAGVDHQQCAFAGGKRARHFIGKIDVAGRVDQIQLVGVSVFRFVMQANAFGFDGDAALAFQVHGIEHLLVHFALRQCAGHLQQAIGKRGFAVIDMRDDTKIADELWVHLPMTGRISLFVMSHAAQIGAV